MEEMKWLNVYAVAIFTCPSYVHTHTDTDRHKERMKRCFINWSSAFIPSTHTHKHKPMWWWARIHVHTRSRFIQIHFIQNYTDYRMRLSTVRIIQFNVMVSVLPFCHFLLLLLLLLLCYVYVFNIISPKCEEWKKTHKSNSKLPILPLSCLLLLSFLLFHVGLFGSNALSVVHAQ